MESGNTDGATSNTMFLAYEETRRQKCKHWDMNRTHDSQAVRPLNAILFGKFWSGKVKRKRPTGRHRRRCEDNIRKDMGTRFSRLKIGISSGLL
jgi:hypothetical protein